MRTSPALQDSPSHVDTMWDFAPVNLARIIFFSHPNDVSEKSDIVKDVIKLKENLNLVLESLKDKQSDIKEPGERILQLETNTHVKKENKCDICEYQLTKSTHK